SSGEKNLQRQKQKAPCGASQSEGLDGLSADLIFVARSRVGTQRVGAHLGNGRQEARIGGIGAVDQRAEIRRGGSIGFSKGGACHRRGHGGRCQRASCDQRSDFRQSEKSGRF